MDDRTFDELTRALGRGGSRRRVLKTWLGAVTGGALAVIGGRSADAQTCRADGRRCTQDANCCSGFCDPTTYLCGCSAECCRDSDCDTLKICVGGVCVFAIPPLETSVETVWAALTEPNALAAWFAENDVAPRVGHRFQLRARPRSGFDGVIEGEVIEIDPPHRLVFSWQGGPQTEPMTATLTLESVGEGTRLKLTNSGGKDGCAAARLVLGHDWQQAAFGTALPRYLARMRREDGLPNRLT